MSTDITLDEIIELTCKYPHEPFFMDELKGCMREAIRQALIPYQWIEIKEGCDLPEYGEKVEVWGEPAGMNPNMGGAYAFITHRQDFKGTLLEGQERRHLDENGFRASYVTYWRRIIPPSQNK